MLMSPSNQNTPKWSRAEFIFQTDSTPEHFTQSWFSAIFTLDDDKKTVRGFYDDNGRFLLRFMPQKEGLWHFQTDSNVPALKGLQGTVNCTPAAEEETGPVETDDLYHFRYANGTPYYPFGTTAYVWNYQSDAIQEQTLASLAASPFNKIRMCVFPKHYTYNLREPERFPFPGNIEDGFDYTRFDCGFFHNLEAQIDALKARGIEADLIIFHPYDRWGFSRMDAETDKNYVDYLVSRLASFSNIWWSLANEFDLLREKPMTFWDGVFEQITATDPYGHLISIHNWHNPPIHYTDNSHWYDQRSPLITHASIQHHDLWFVPAWRDEFRKPVVIDECRYEGDVDLGWGNITARKMVELTWEGVCAGSYVTHGESYLSDDDIIWWSHGGRLKGESPARIAFLLDLIKDGEPKRLSPWKGREHNQWDATIGHMEDDYWLVWFGENQPGFKWLKMLPEGKEFYVDVIDAWEMTIERQEGTFRYGDKLPLPGRPGIALRMTVAG
ncbi:DUF5605 domain-containing protein [Klebsiella aerogenes]|uniref:DUF5605 domain-containing protein n=1 Tax=Klebsiella aerogenes TaxID=548 RepID=UPI00244922B7|nr:DUF4038 domain-containing protein [Klebsiella aerogenes]MDH1612578.1 DUF4038 domain-containing protein [Klebsiella aerogenes]